MKRVLIVDDEPNIRSSLSTTFRLDGYEVQTADDGEQALRAVEREAPDLLLLDLQMPRLDGLATLRELRRRGFDVPVVFLTAHGTIEKAVRAVRLGAWDFLEKPPHAEKLLVVARNALRQRDLEEENRELREAAEGEFDMIGASPPMQRLYERVRLTAPTEARVLILGENGTGKELIARALHRHSPRSSKPFVRVNCAAIPRELFESELFGHERGAFTGATARRRGKFVRADGGTLFLDEVAEIPPLLQAKLLRAIESGEIEPVGAEREQRVDVRVIAATNRDIERDVEAERFRSDLFYRLQVVTITAPPLRERPDDIPALAEHFLIHASADNHLPPKRLSDPAVERLRRHAWPGNVRELRNLIERLVILERGEVLDERAVVAALPAARAESLGEASGTLRESLTAVERRLVEQALERNDWNMTATAERLGLERSHLYKKLKALGIERPAGD